jgi:hypothetical protein
METAKAIEVAFKTTNCTAFQAHRVIESDEWSEHCFRGRYGVSGSITSAQRLNDVRCLCILANESIMHGASLAPDSPEVAERSDQAMRNIRQLAIEVCESVAYILGAVPAHLLPPQERKYQLADGMTLLWPLFVVCDAVVVDDDTREWARKRLEYLNSIAGIRQAGLMADSFLLEGAHFLLPDFSCNESDVVGIGD